MSCPLASTGQCGHDDHELGKASSISACQHLRGHGDERTEQHGAHALTHLAVVSYNVSSKELQQLPVLLHRVQLVWVFGWWGSHACEPGLKPHWLHTGQLCQRTTKTQQARVGALLRYTHKKGMEYIRYNGAVCGLEISLLEFWMTYWAEKAWWRTSEPGCKI